MTFQPKVSLKSKVYTDAPFQSGNRSINITEIEVDNSLVKNVFDTIILVDRSASMSVHLYYIRAILKSMYDRLHDIHGRLTVVSFNDKAELMYTSDYMDRDLDERMKYTDIVDRLEAVGRTNIQSALELSFGFVKKGVRSLMCLITDGRPNVGNTSSRFFSGMISTLPLYCVVNTIGFGQLYSERILKAIGQLTHIDNIKQVPGVIGSMIGVIESMIGYGGFIETPNSQNTAAIGVPSVRLLYYASKYFYATYVRKDKVEGMVGKRVRFIYTDMEGEKHELETDIEMVETTPADVKEKYYRHQAIKIIGRIHKTEDTRCIIRRINLWPKEGEVARKTIYSAISDGIDIKILASLQEAISYQISYSNKYDVLQQSTIRQDKYISMMDDYASSYI